LDYNRFTVALRARAEDFDKDNLITGGRACRWFGLNRSTAGHLEVTFNNGESRHELKATTLTAGEWFVVACAVDLMKRKVQVCLNGKSAGDVDLPADFALRVTSSEWKDVDRLWTFTNYSNGQVFHGLVD